MYFLILFYVCVLAQDHVIVVATCSLFNMVVQLSRQQYTSVNWNGNMPLDVSDYRIRFPDLRCLFSLDLGWLLWVGILKIPMGRECFTECYTLLSYVEDEQQRIFQACQDACRRCATSVEKQHFDDECREIRGPLRQHGFIEEMKRMHVIEKADAPVKSSLQLGVTGFYYNILSFSSHAAASINSICQLHLTIYAILIFGPPRSLQDWKKHRALLMEAVVRFEVSGLSALNYCFDYSVRLLLDGLMHAERAPALLLKDRDLIDDLPGPDQMSHRQHLKEAFGCTHVKPLVRYLKMTHSVHPLLGIACMVSSSTLSVVWNGASSTFSSSSKKCNYVEDCYVDGKYINVAGVCFQTQKQFLEYSCALDSVCGRRVSNPEQNIWKAVFDERRYSNKDKMILKQSSSRGYHVLLGDLLNNGQDIMKSSFSKRVVAYRPVKYDADCDLLLYRVDAMVNIAQSV